MLLAAVLALHLIPRPAQVEQPAACSATAAPLTAPAGFDPGALDELNERWRALGIGTVRSVSRGVRDLGDARRVASAAGLPSRRSRGPREDRKRRSRGYVLCRDDAGAASPSRGRRVADSVRVDIRPSRAAVARALRRRFARAVADDALFQRTHPHDRGIQDERLFAVHGARVRQPDRSASGSARRDHARAAARTRALRRTFSRRADSRTADVRAHAQHASIGTIRLCCGVSARLSAGAERSAFVGISVAHRRSGTRSGSASAVFSHRIRRDRNARSRARRRPTSRSAGAPRRMRTISSL